MAEIIRMPRLSDTMEEGNIVAWLKKVGDKVSPGDILAEVETDKATMELESFHEGYLLYISKEEGPVPVNEVLAVIGEKDEDYKSLLESSNGGTKDGKAGKAKDEKPKEEKKDKPEDVKAPPQEDVKEEAGENLEKEQAESPANKKDSGSDQRIKSSPLAKSMAAEAGVDLAAIKGTGDQGRIIKRDVEEYVSAGKESKQKQPDTPAVQYGEVPLSQMRKTIARRLAESKFSAPHFYLTVRINMDKIAEARKLFQDSSDTKLSFNDFIIKGCALALKKHPQVNSSWMGDKIRVNKDINIGVAVAVDEGLLVPVLFGTDQMGLNEINSQVNDLAERARQKKLQPQEMQGNTFTVSNLGMFGIDEFTAIINPPDSAIMAIGTISDELVLVNSNVSTTKIMKVTMSCDHRVIDGATGAKFLQTFKQFMENPVTMLI